ncbi:MAG: RyR domain-containing protein [Halanaerobiales bacterium]
MNEDKLIERLAELEHIKWMDWARHILSEEVITTQRVQRWVRNFVPYNELSEGEKEKDRVLARKVLRTLKEEGYEI